MEQIYTIPVNEAFDEVGEKQECGCPFCVLYRKLQNDEIDIILGASMMEPDIRIKTNEQGFCLPHYNMMLRRKRMLGMGLILESHLAEVEKKIDGPKLLGNKVQSSIDSLGRLNSDCYVCNRIGKNLSAMIATAVYLFESDLDFPAKFKKVPYFCLPHYKQMMEYASKKMPKRHFRDFYDAAHGIQKSYVESLRGDVSWFCKKFDYRYDEEPWYNSKDSVQRSIKFLSGELGYDD
ncbi:MAG: hypothetical protein E7612_02940 [Ruminococcaceae bacterium]|nr:hypothetical protein [Oscillospiraceae bacterium]